MQLGIGDMNLTRSHKLYQCIRYNSCHGTLQKVVVLQSGWWNWSILSHWHIGWRKPCTSCLRHNGRAVKTFGLDACSNLNSDVTSVGSRLWNSCHFTIMWLMTDQSFAKFPYWTRPLHSTDLIFFVSWSTTMTHDYTTTMTMTTTKPLVGLVISYQGCKSLQHELCMEKRCYVLVSLRLHGANASEYCNPPSIHQWVSNWREKIGPGVWTAGWIYDILSRIIVHCYWLQTNVSSY